MRIAVHSLQPAVCVGKSRRHVHLAADDFDVGPGFVSRGPTSRCIELAERSHSRSEPVAQPSALGNSGSSKERVPSARGHVGKCAFCLGDGRSDC
jgi:hypothetical protein